MSRLIFFACLMALVVSSQIFAQAAGGDTVSPQEMIDVIYLKDGRIVRGKVVEKTDEFLIVQTRDGSLSTFQEDQIATILQEEASKSTGPAASMNTAKGQSSGVGKLRLSGGLILDPGTGWVANVGFAMPNWNYMDFLGLVEGLFDQSSEDILGSDITYTYRTIGVNAVMLYKYKKWHFLGGVGLARHSVSVGRTSSGVSDTRLNFTVGAGMTINKLLFAEVRSSSGSDLALTVGIKIP